MRPTRTLFAFVLLLAAAGCGPEDPIPAKPTWVDDVEPILRGSCFHCHGSESVRLNADSRFDIYKADPLDPCYMDLGIQFEAIRGGKMEANNIGIFVALKDEKTRMPPQPATRLPSRDIEVLKRWSMTGAERGTRNPNARPVAKLLSVPKAIGQGAWEVQLLVSDADHDQVLGKVTLGGTATRQILHAGAHTFVFESPPADKALTVSLCDGQERADGPPLPP
jgi:hypothetical protein